MMVCLLHSLMICCVVSDEDDGEAAMMSDFEILDECYAAD